MLVTRNFSLEEALRSRDHPGLTVQVADLDIVLIFNIARMSHAMERAREIVGLIDVLSWIRSLPLNQAVGGSPESRHVLGLAVDFRPRHLTAREAFRSLSDAPGRPIFDRLTLYPSGRLHGDLAPLEDGPPRGLKYVSESTGWRRLQKEEWV